MKIVDFFRSKGTTHDNEGLERKGIIDNVFVNLDDQVIVQRYPYDNLSTRSVITVQEGQMMVFMSEGMYSETFYPGKHTITTNNIPFLEKIANLPYGGSTAFKTTLYVFRTSVVGAGNNCKWGTGMDIVDRTLGGRNGATIKVGAHGTYTFRITNPVEFIRQIMDTRHTMTIDEAVEKVALNLPNAVKSSITNCFMTMPGLSVTNINAYNFQIMEQVKESLNRYYFEKYGLKMEDLSMDITPIESDPNYQKLRAKQATVSASDMEAEADRYKTEQESDALRYKRQNEGYTYQEERKMDILQDAAANTGTGGDLMGAGIGLGMAIGMGGAFGPHLQNIAQSTFTNPIMQNPGIPPQGYSQQPQQNPAMPQQTTGVPPQSVPQQPTGGQPAAGQPTAGGNATAKILVNGNELGPFDLNTLKGFVQQGLVNHSTMVQLTGNDNWSPAGTVAELITIFF